ncbi:MAG: xanthine dehydrogenase family protein molybdopterin-binding subunit [Candidatus Brocadiia bacterium]|nr:MAG: xanthine dehydrogenase family protein molybdopterin-binding subunit [Candidatus Brocadiia bacterium]
MIIAEELGLEPADVRITIGDTEYGLAPTSGGSQTTAGITPAVRIAAYAARQRILEIAASELEVRPDQLKLENGRVYAISDAKKQLPWKEICKKIPRGEFSIVGNRRPDYYRPERFKISGIQFAAVEVDTGTGIIKVKRMFAVHDCGRPMDRLTLENQINGGIIQGISYALFEDRRLDRNTGVMVNPNLENYKIAGSLDVPIIESHILNVNLGQSSTGAIGIGEPATIPTAAAIANAVYHAIGVRIRELPMTPARVLAALKKIE